MPRHNHYLNDSDHNAHSWSWGAGVGTVYVPGANVGVGQGEPGTNPLATYQNVSNVTGQAGGGDPVDILPPYETVYIWERTA